MAVLERRKHRPRGRVMPARRTPEAGKQAVRQLVAQVQQAIEDQSPAIPRAELWATCGVTQSAANLMLAGKSTNRLVIARIAEVLCRSNTRARVFIASIKTRRDIRRALEHALPLLQQDAAENIQVALAEVRVRLHRLGQGHE